VDSFVEILVILLIRKDSGLELHETVSIRVVSFPYRLVGEYDPAVLIGHLLRFLVQFFLFRRKNLRNGKTSLLCLLFQHLLFIFKSE
jgi:hypothetical protein